VSAATAPGSAIDLVVASILALRREQPTRVLIDGRSAAGKSTFAATLGERLAGSGREILTVHFDDFHPVGYRPLGSSVYSPERYLDEGFDFGALERLVIAPTALAGSRRVICALPGASDASAGETLIAEDGILLVEGAFLLKPALRGWWDFAIWLDVGFDTMVGRAVARDVAWVGDPDKVRARYEGFWTETHSLYEACGARDAAHAVIDNEAPANPRLVRFTRPPS
jgi:uridine kinase